jgi:hypothetical protein
MPLLLHVWVRRSRPGFVRAVAVGAVYDRAYFSFEEKRAVIGGVKKLKLQKICPLSLGEGASASPVGRSLKER